MVDTATAESQPGVPRKARANRAFKRMALADVLTFRWTLPHEPASEPVPSENLLRSRPFLSAVVWQEVPLAGGMFSLLHRRITRRVVDCRFGGSGGSASHRHRETLGRHPGGPASGALSTGDLPWVESVSGRSCPGAGTCWDSSGSVLRSRSFCL